MGFNKFIINEKQKMKDMLFEKYNITDEKPEWDDFDDNWISVEIYRLVYNELPKSNDTSVIWVSYFLDKENDVNFLPKTEININIRNKYFKTARKMVALYYNELISEIGRANMFKQEYNCDFIGDVKCNNLDFYHITKVNMYY